MLFVISPYLNTLSEAKAHLQLHAMDVNNDNYTHSNKHAERQREGFGYRNRSDQTSAVAEARTCPHNQLFGAEKTEKE